MKVGNYEFELKGFKYLESRSEETYCFGATLYVNGKRFADCGNSGHGGPTDVHIFPECRAFGNEVEEFLSKQPKIKCEEYDFEMDCDLEYVVDELVQKLLEAKEMKRIMNKTKNSLVFKGVDGEYYTMGWKSKALTELIVKHPIGRESIKKTIAEQVAKGSVLINENIPSDLLPGAK